jgi:hypothetical protein
MDHSISWIEADLVNSKLCSILLQTARQGVSAKKSFTRRQGAPEPLEDDTTFGTARPRTIMFR